MNNAALLRTLVIYAVVVPLAIVVGYVLTNPMDYSSLGFFAVLALLLASPLLLRLHFPLLVFSLSASISFFFLPTSPSMWLVMVILSLGISVLERIMSRDRHFIRAPQITWPLIFLIVVILFTAKLTGGFGLRSFGSEVYGGKKYVFLILGLLGYFAMTARPIPPEKAKTYVALFFLSAVTLAVGDLFSVSPGWARFVFWVFPPSYNAFNVNGFELGQTRLGGIGGAGIAICLWLLARYGIRGIFLEGKLWRPCLWVICFGLDFLGGFRSGILAVAAPFVLMFFMEGLHRTRLLPVAILSGIVAVVTIVPLAPHLPFTFQRALAFLPLDISQEAADSAQASLDWRMAMWKAVLPQVPQHLLLGKGLAISPEDYNEMMGNTTLGTAAGQFDPSQDPLALSYDYHNGPLSVVLPFGIWGFMAYVWMMVAGLWVLYSNWKYGDPALRTVNALLFAVCLPDFLGFASCMAGYAMNVGCAYWAGHIGMSVALNNGVCRRKSPAMPERPVVEPAATFSRLRPGFQQ